MSELKITTIACAIHRKGTSATLGEHSIRIELADEGGGPFFIVKSADIDDRNELRLDPDELDALCNTGRRLIRRNGDGRSGR